MLQRCNAAALQLCNAASLYAVTQQHAFATHDRPSATVLLQLCMQKRKLPAIVVSAVSCMLRFACCNAACCTRCTTAWSPSIPMYEPSPTSIGRDTCRPALRCYRMTSRRANPALGAPATAAWTPRRHTVGRVVRCKSHDRELRTLLPGRMRAGLRRAASQALRPGSTSAVPRPSRTCSGIAARTCAGRAQTPLERRTHANGEITTAIIAATHDGWGAAIGAPTHLVGVAGGGVGGVVAVPVQRQREVQRAAVEQVRRPGTSTPSTLQYPVVPEYPTAPSITLNPP